MDIRSVQIMMKQKYFAYFVLNFGGHVYGDVSCGLDHSANFSDFIRHRLGSGLGLDPSEVVGDSGGLSQEFGLGLSRIIRLKSAEYPGDNVMTYVINDLCANPDTGISRRLDNSFDCSPGHEIGLSLLQSFSGCLGLEIGLRVDAKHGARFSSGESMFLRLGLIDNLGRNVDTGCGYKHGRG